MAISYRPQLRSLLLAVNCLVLLLPVSGIFLLKMYESQLIRQTEAALIGQAALLSSMYAQELALQANNENLTIKYGSILPIDSPFHNTESFTPVNPLLDVATETILPPSPSGERPILPADPLSLAVGKKLIPVLKKSQRITLCGIRIMESNGIVVSSSGSELGLSLAHRQEIKRAIKGYYASVLRKRISDEPSPPYSSLSRKGSVRVLVGMPIIHDQQIVGAVLLSRSPIGLGKGLYFIRKHLLLGSVLVLSIVIAITWLTNVVISRPLKQLVVRTKKIKSHGGELEPLTHPGTKEVEELSGAISEMANTLQKRADYIQNFARHVSHEFKTPITAILGSIELMQDLGQEMSQEDQNHFLKNMDQDVRHLDQLTRGLLNFARADMASPGITSFDPAEIIQQILEQLNEDERSITAEFQVGNTTILMEREIFRGIITNLIENSFRHGNATKVNIALSRTEHHNATGTQIYVTDNGCGVLPTNWDKIFTPFFTTARNSGGTGLGLTIIKAIVENHDGQIALSTSYEKGCRFSLFLPKDGRNQTVDKRP